jgi:hypothetical protein
MEIGDENNRSEIIGHTKVIYELQKILGINEIHKIRLNIIFHANQS